MDSPEEMVIVPPGCYCVITNPAVKSELTGEVLFDEFGQVGIVLIFYLC